jgi:preprotein translocase subunit SecE
MKLFEFIDKISVFITEVGVELKKSAWPTRSELIESTIVVIISVVILAVFVGICDLFLMRILKLIV